MYGGLSTWSVCRSRFLRGSVVKGVPRKKRSGMQLVELGICRSKPPLPFGGLNIFHASNHDLNIWASNTTSCLNPGHHFSPPFQQNLEEIEELKGRSREQASTRHGDIHGFSLGFPLTGLDPSDI